MKRIIGLAMAAVVVLSVSALIFTGCAPKAEPGKPDKIEAYVFPKTTLINGYDVTGKTKEQALKLLESKGSTEDPEQLTINVVYDGEKHTLTQDDFRIDNNVSTSVNNAYNYFFGNGTDDFYKKKIVLDVENKIPGHEGVIEFSSKPSANRRSIEGGLKKLARSLNTDPVEPKVVDVEDGKFVVEGGKNGVSIDETDLIKQVNAQLDKGETEITVKAKGKTTAPKQTAKDFQKYNVTQLSTFNTISTNTADGNTNMRLALEYCNDYYLEPGETFSFNGTVGDSTNNSRGFVPAGVISNNQSATGYGGGICQASTTIYGAAARADMTIVERYNHTWPSTYVPIGVDASIEYGGGDFKFRNDTKTPIFMRCYMEGTTLTCTIYGVASSEWDEIEVTSEQTGYIDQPATEYIDDPSLPSGEKEVEREGFAGQTAVASRIYYKNGEQVKTESLPDSYYPAVGSIIRVGTGSSGSNDDDDDKKASSKSDDSSKADDDD